MSSRIGAIAAAIMLLIGAPAGTAYGDAAGPSKPPAPTDHTWLEIVDSRDLPGRVIAAGRVLRADGKAAAGARVTLAAWPSEEVDRTLKVGDSFRLTPVAKTVTASDGSFELRVAPGTRVRQLASANGHVDLEILADTTDGLTSFSFTAAVADSSSEGELVALTAEEDSDEDISDVDMTLEQPSDPESCAAAADGDEPASASCTIIEDGFESDESGAGVTTTLVQNYGPRWVLAGATYINTMRVTSRFTYTTSAEQYLGRRRVSIRSIRYLLGEWYRKQVVDRLGFPVQGDNSKKHFYTSYVYGKYRITTCGFTLCSVVYKVRARYFAGGADLRTPSSYPTANYCRSYAAGAWHEKTSTNANTWSNGAKLGSAIGIDLSSRTGYRAEAKVKI